MKHLSYWVLIIIIISSCQKQKEILNPKEEAPSLTVQNGIIVFKDDASFSTTLKELNNLDNEDFKQWEVNVGFTSLRSEIDNVMDLINDCQSQTAFDNIIEANQDILMIEDSVILPKIKSSYINFINREGLFYIGEVLHKVDEDLMAASFEGDLNKINEALIRSK